MCECEIKDSTTLSAQASEKRRLAREIRKDAAYVQGQAYYQAIDRARQLESEAGQLAKQATDLLTNNASIKP